MLEKLMAVLVLFAATEAAAGDTEALRARLQSDGQAVTAVEVGGVLVLRGEVGTGKAAADAEVTARSLGFQRIANLIRIERSDDEALTRRVERELSLSRLFDDCRLRVQVAGGIVHLSARVGREDQKQTAVEMIRAVDGVASVTTHWVD